MVNTTTTNSKARPYKPSWLDQFTNWVEKLPIQTWVFYVGLGLVLILIQILFLWLDGGQQAEILLPTIIFNGLVTPFLPALMYMLDNQAVTALKSMTPSLEMTEPEFDMFQYKLSTMSNRGMLLASLVVIVLVFLTERLVIAPLRYAALEQLPNFAVIFHIVDKSPMPLVGIFIYHTIKQLRLVNAINSNYIRVSLFYLKPLQAFSRLTASTAVGLVVVVYGWILINPEMLTEPIPFGLSGGIAILTIAVFVWPLYNAHHLMKMEKEGMLQSIDLCFEAAFLKFNQRFRDDDFDALDRLNGTIASLEIQRKRIEAVSPWPWRSDTARFTFTAIALPLVLRVLQFLVERAF